MEVQKEKTDLSGVCKSLIIRNGNGWLAGCILFIYLYLFSSAIQMVCVNFPVFDNIRQTSVSVGMSTTVKD